MVTPIRRQYLRIKQQHPDAIVLFRLGDFYETFDKDAEVTSRELGITLTSREMGKGNRIPLAGIPYHALDSYLGKLIGRGYKVAICEQLTDPAASKGLVERDVVRVVTPGTVVEPNLLDQRANNYLAALVTGEGEAGLAYVDITTGEFVTSQLLLSQLGPEMDRLRPSELLLPKGEESPPSGASPAITHVDYIPDGDDAEEALEEHFGVATLEGFGCAHLPLAIRAAALILRYLEHTQRAALGELTSLATHVPSQYMILNEAARRNLELFQGGRSGLLEHSLLGVLDLTRTAMGARLLRRWLGQPLLNVRAINARLDGVEYLFSKGLVRSRATALLSQVSDIERITNRVKSGVAIPRELVTLKRSLEAVQQLLDALSEEEALPELLAPLNPCQDVFSLIARAIADDPPSSFEQGGVIRDGFSQELDELRGSSSKAKDYIAGLERQERERSGVKSLKVGYNKVFGYYIEITNPHLSQVPQDYIRKQTLANAERYFTPELKEYESLILNAQSRIAEMESGLFRQVCAQVGDASERLLASARAIAQIDVYCSLAEAASRYGYVRPAVNDGDAIDIKGGRHPAVERVLPQGSFVPNDLYLSNADAQLLVITGPNMAGKSTYLRQAALIVLMAQVGSFAPADSATIGLVDRIFTRVGLQDDLATGQSTFMVEMVETAQILNNATSRSLIILDEIGRGTSTYDGLSIARAVAEHLHNHPRLGCKTLFATHYHELVDLAGYLPRVRNYNVAVAEEGGTVVFLHRIVPGGADKSYGIHVAQLAGLPRPVIHRAQEVLTQLEADGRKAPESGPSRRDRGRQPAQQLPLLPAPSQLLEELMKLEVESLTPLEAITKLFELQEKAKEERGP